MTNEQRRAYNRSKRRAQEEQYTSCRKDDVIILYDKYGIEVARFFDRPGMTLYEGLLRDFNITFIKD